MWYNWLLLVELDAMTGDVPLRKYTWGRDLSGLRALGTDGVALLTAAGGIGGLLAVWDSADTPSNTGDDLTYVFFYDANGNVSQVVDLEDLPDWQSLGLTGPADWHASRLAARYEYDPYGNLIGPDTNSDGVFDSADDPGPYASRNPFRFSTKSFDDETGFGYWGYRYYWPKLGRWLSRDPIGELGGVNLYAYAQNSPAAAIDPLGQYCVMGNPCGGPGDPDPCPQTPANPSPIYPGMPPGAVYPSVIGGVQIFLCSRSLCASVCATYGNAYGVTVCDAQGRPCACICDQKINRDYRNRRARQLIRECVARHEQHHISNNAQRCPNGRQPPRPGDECVAQRIDISCARRAVFRCGGDRQCIRDLRNFIRSASCRPSAGQQPCPPNQQRACECDRYEALRRLNQLLGDPPPPRPLHCSR